MIYYNEHDPKAAAWLRELIAQGHLPPGDVDPRDIQLVQPDDLVAYTQCHFFAGIGGWALAALLAGIPTTTRLWTGSCPCQPFSVAGKGLGTRDPRHLWPHFRRLIRLCRPPVVVGEQVASAAGRDWLSGVCADLEALAYRTAAADLCAAGGQEDCTLGILRGDQVTYERGTLSAPHIRQRLWWCAGRLATAKYRHGRSQQPARSTALNWWARPARSGPDGGLGISDRARWQPGESPTSPPGHGNTAQSAGNLSGLGDPQSGGCGELRHAPQPGSGGHTECAGGTGFNDSGLGNSPGDDKCRTGKSRTLNGRTEPLGGSGTGSDCGLADTHGGHTCPKWEQCGWKQRQFKENGISARWLAQPDQGKCGRLPDGQRCQPHWTAPGRQQSHRQLEPHCHSCGTLAGYPHGVHSLWGHFDLIPCRDGKTRRIESGTFPLAHGVPGRVGLLRGYGNAIVPQRAADFLRCALEALQETPGVVVPASAGSGNSGQQPSTTANPRKRRAAASV